MQGVNARPGARPVLVVGVPRSGTTWIAGALGSWVDMGFDELGTLPDDVIAPRAERWGDEPLPRSAPLLARVAWRVAFQWLALEEAARSNLDFVRVSHEDVCTEPIPALRGLAERLGLGWNELAGDWVFHSNQPGKAYDLNVSRPSRPCDGARACPARSATRFSRCSTPFP